MKNKKWAMQGKQELRNPKDETKQCRPKHTPVLYSVV